MRFLKCKPSIAFGVKLNENIINKSLNSCDLHDLKMLNINRNCAS